MINKIDFPEKCWLNARLAMYVRIHVTLRRPPVNCRVCSLSCPACSAHAPFSERGEGGEVNEHRIFFNFVYNLLWKYS